MCPKKTALSYAKSVRGFTLPQFHQSSKNSYVDFCAIDPASGELKRKKYHLSPKLGKRRQRQAAAEMMAELTSKLSGGWSPWIDMSGARTYTLIEDVLDRYLEAIKRQGRRKTLFTYTSRVNIFRKWIETLNPKPLYSCQIDKAICIKFLDYIYIDRHNSPRTRNNYLGWLVSLCQYMMDHGFLDANPAASIHKIKEFGKFRQPLTPQMMVELRQYLEKHDRHFLLAVLMEYSTFIRPTELTNIRIGDISVKEQTISISGEYSKNHRDAKIALPRMVLDLMLDLDIFSHPDSDYIFSKDMKPGSRKYGGDIFNHRWKPVRKALKWDECYQFYSLKDTGIKDISNTLGVVTARDQARHSDISTTNKYLQGKDRISEELKDFKGAFSDDV